MSEALDYLLQTRPEAMGHYFAFLKSAGESLDPKTRALISVLTKVPNRTERGFRQYTKRALKAGVSGAEVLDALIMAFPIIGLSGLVWAVDLLLEMDLPEFSPETLAALQDRVESAPRSWQPLAPLGELADRCNSKSIAQTDFLVIREGENFTVFNAQCPHQGGRVQPDTESPEQGLCPRHQWRFDLRDGRCVSGNQGRLLEVESRVVDEFLEILIA